MKLRVKDLQHFLTRKKINIKSCVGKKTMNVDVISHKLEAKSFPCWLCCLLEEQEFESFIEISPDSDFRVY